MCPTCIAFLRMVSTHPREGTKTFCQWCRIRSFHKFQLTPARGRKRSPASILRMQTCAFQLTPARGRKRGFRTFPRSLLCFNSPPRGDENYISLLLFAVTEVSTHPREGTKTDFAKSFLNILRFQLTPARGRKPKTVYLHHQPICFNSPPRGDENLC